MNFFDLSGWIVGVLGLALSVFFGFRAEVTKREAQSVTWREITSGCAHIASAVRRDGLPDLIIATDARGGMIGRIVTDSTRTNIPVLVGLCFDSREGCPDDLLGYVRMNSGRWCYFIPELAFSADFKDVLIVDDAVFTGLTMKTLTEKLGQATRRVRTAALFTSKLASSQGVAPTYVWRETAHNVLFFPWGRMR